MDTEAIRGIEADLVAWGVLERTPRVELTRRFRAALARAASELAQEEIGRTGRRSASDPISTALERAFADFPLPPDAQVRPEHQLFARGVEIASLPPAALDLIMRKE